MNNLGTKYLYIAVTNNYSHLETNSRGLDYHLKI